MPFLSSPHEAFSAGFYGNPEFDYAVRRLLGHAAAGCSEPGEVLATIAGIRDNDYGTWFTAWRDLGLRLNALAEDSRDADRFDSASGAYLRAASYLAMAVRTAPDDALGEVFAEHRRAWDGFIDTTVYSVERVDIPYEASSLPGYLIAPSDDGEARATIILTSSSDGGHSCLWGDLAHGALGRGYSVLLFDGPGQQSMLFEREIALRHDWEAVIAPIVDALAERDDVDESRLALYGTGMGGYAVPRALAFEDRLAAAVVDPGVVDAATLWMRDLPRSLAALFAEGKRDAFDRDMELAMRFAPANARAWASRARPFRSNSYFDTLTEVAKFALGDAVEQITTPMFITAAEHEQFWPGQSETLAESLGELGTLQRFTAAEGADFHAQPLARQLTQQRIFDWLDETLGSENSP